MTNKEMTEVFSVLMLAYPKAELFQGGIQKLEPTIKLWTNCFKDIPYQAMQKAVYDLIKTNPFPPTIAELTNCLKQGVVNAELTAPALWQDFNKAVDKIISYMDNFRFTWIQEDGRTQGEHFKMKAKQYFESLPKVFQDYAGSYSGMLQICRDYDGMSKQSISYEKHRFDEFIKHYIESKTYTELIEFTNDNNLQLKARTVNVIDKR